MRFRLTSLIVVTSLWLVACEQDSVTLRVAAPDLPVDYEIAADLASMLDESAPVRLALSSSAMTESAALDALIAGEADIALVSNAMPFREGIATVVPLYPTVLHVAYHQGRDASSSTSLLTGA